MAFFYPDPKKMKKYVDEDKAYAEWMVRANKDMDAWCDKADDWLLAKEVENARITQQKADEVIRVDRWWRTHDAALSKVEAGSWLLDDAMRRAAYVANHAHGRIVKLGPIAPKELT